MTNASNKIRHLDVYANHSLQDCNSHLGDFGSQCASPRSGVIGRAPDYFFNLVAQSPLTQHFSGACCKLTCKVNIHVYFTDSQCYFQYAVTHPKTDYPAFFRLDSSTHYQDLSTLAGDISKKVVTAHPICHCSAFTRVMCNL